MREILFHGKRADNGEWVEGDLLQTRYHSGHIEYQIMPQTPVSSAYPVLPETVGQYTGLTDKNGVRIFEGDILRGFEYPFCSNINGEFNYFAEIVWFDDSSAFGIYTFKNPKSNVRGISEGNTDYLEYFNADKWEVIGNIYDNPELLEGGGGDG